MPTTTLGAGLPFRVTLPETVASEFFLVGFVCEFARKHIPAQQSTSVGIIAKGAWDFIASFPFD
jgi:hypothetical protein